MPRDYCGCRCLLGSSLLKGTQILTWQRTLGYSPHSECPTHLSSRPVGTRWYEPSHLIGWLWSPQENLPLQDCSWVRCPGSWPPLAHGCCFCVQSGAFWAPLLVWNGTDLSQIRVVQHSDLKPTQAEQVPTFHTSLCALPPVCTDSLLKALAKRAGLSCLKSSCRPLSVDSWVCAESRVEPSHDLPTGSL